MTGPTFQETQIRVSDCTVQTRCDKRTLATLTKFFLHNRGYVISMSELIRISLEMLEQMVVEQDESLASFSTEEADLLLRQQYKANMHPLRKLKVGGAIRPKYDYSFRKQLDLEDAFIEGRLPAYVRPATKDDILVRKAKDNAAVNSSDVGSPEFRAAFQRGLQMVEDLRQGPESRQFRTPDNMVDKEKPTGECVEAPEQAEKRRAQELRIQKAALAAVPSDIIATTNDNNDNNDNKEN